VTGAFGFVTLGVEAGRVGKIARSDGAGGSFRCTLTWAPPGWPSALRFRGCACGVPLLPTGGRWTALGAVVVGVCLPASANWLAAVGSIEERILLSSCAFQVSISYLPTTHRGQESGPLSSRGQRYPRHSEAAMLNASRPVVCAMTQRLTGDSHSFWIRQAGDSLTQYREEAVARGLQRKCILSSNGWR
jgi:hypothetical protein